MVLSDFLSQKNDLGLPFAQKIEQMGKLRRAKHPLFQRGCLGDRLVGQFEGPKGFLGSKVGGRKGVRFTSLWPSTFGVKIFILGKFSEFYPDPRPRPNIFTFGENVVDPLRGSNLGVG